jgi:hypothetical protein
MRPQVPVHYTQTGRYQGSRESSQQVCSWTPRTRSGCRLGIQEALDEHPACGAGCSFALASPHRERAHWRAAHRSLPSARPDDVGTAGACLIIGFLSQMSPRPPRCSASASAVPMSSFKAIATPTRWPQEAWVKESNAVAIHAFDRDETMLGQGTVDVELAGAGLIAGIAAWYAGNVVGVEPLTSRCLPMPGRRAIP